ncbi:hypothetical protein CfE428DRAFT_6494 [Chthoniobacter flavus Ellin428]|uniref:Uncharacterized protein n=1 Tax=Chthoniobacter flavus Ellin428 TaxID=497964 RepID=B4DC53_9BACT|nr:hypothetical protein [Chthoniobacter flavus]EDY15975.1 hypothetical protein CfE428DRAFT_6494 [Chthoniobacter flavus Ellin428]TCO83289.1 hypothetical protein EV701_1429 [Chthoniobacter flavus]
MTPILRRVLGLARRPAKQTGIFSRNGVRRGGAWLQLLALIFLLLEPLSRSGALYVPDNAGNPYWLQLPSEGAPGGSPDGDWQTQFQDALSAGLIEWWGGGTWYIDGQSVTLLPQYHVAGVGDSDGDGVPDDLDPYPNDANNNTVYWPGGVYMIDNVAVSFSPIYAQAGMLPDSDGDGIPDSVDPYPNDPNNGNGTGGGGDTGGTFTWNGGDFWIDGMVQHFSGGTYNGSGTDSDGDGIPDVLDPYPNDASNNTAWWQGGNFMVDGNLTTFAGQYHRADSGDADTDGIPDDLDPYPNDPTNNSYWWAGGWYQVNGSSLFFPPQWLAGNGTDSDGDGIPDVVDPYPNDATNGTGNNGTANWWAGGTFLVNGQYSWYPGQYYYGATTDSDGDGIPDVLDPYPSDLWNNTYFTWNGGTYLVNGSWMTFPSATYGGLWSDRDGDGIPDVADPYPDDANNNNPVISNNPCSCGHSNCPGSACSGTSGSPENCTCNNVPPPVCSCGHATCPGAACSWVNDPANCACVDPLTDNSGPDTDGDGMSDSYEIANGLDPNNPADAANAPMGDLVFNVEKAQHGLAIDTVVSAADYASITGHPLVDYFVDPSKSVAEQDWDGNGISNIDELLVFHTDPRDPYSKPTDDQIKQALLEGKCSLTTRANYFWLLDGSQVQVGGGFYGDGAGLPTVAPSCNCTFVNRGCPCKIAGQCGNDCVPQCSCDQPDCNCKYNGSNQVCSGGLLCHECDCDVKEQNAGCVCADSHGCNNDCIPCSCPAVGSGCYCLNVTQCNPILLGAACFKPTCATDCGCDTYFCECGFQQTYQCQTDGCGCTIACCQCGGEPANCNSINLYVWSFILINANNNNGSPVDQFGFPQRRDYDVSPIPGGDGDLAPLNMVLTRIPPEGATVHLEAISGGDKIKVWNDPEKHIPIPLPYDVSADSLQPLFVEGVHLSATAGDVTLKASVNIDGTVLSSQATITVGPVISNINRPYAPVDTVGGLTARSDVDADIYYGGPWNGRLQLVQNVRSLSGNANYPFHNPPILNAGLLSGKGDPLPLLDALTSDKPYYEYRITNPGDSSSSFHMTTNDSPAIPYPPDPSFYTTMQGREDFSLYYLWRFNDGTVLPIAEEDWYVIWDHFNTSPTDFNPYSDTGSHQGQVIIGNDTPRPPKMDGPVANDEGYHWKQ